MNNRVSIPVMAVVLCLATCLPVVSAQPLTLDTVKPGSYKVDPNHTQVVFSLSHLGFTEFTGLFAGASGTLQLDPRKLSDSKLDISIAMDSVTTTVAKLTDELKSAQWFDVTQYPVASFVSKKITKTGPETATIAGDLTLHGQTHPVVLKARFIGAGVNPIDKAYTVGFEASATIRRADFDVKLYLPMVGDEVKLVIAGAFEAQP
jgi:polyisoprenoid-binding protein YceI